MHRRCRLSAEPSVSATLADPKVKDRFADVGGEPIGGLPADFCKIITRSGQSHSGREHQSGVIASVLDRRKILLGARSLKVCC